MIRVNVKIVSSGNMDQKREDSWRTMTTEQQAEELQYSKETIVEWVKNDIGAEVVDVIVEIVDHGIDA